MSHTLVRPEAGAVVEVHDLRGTGAHPTTPPVLHDPSGRRAARIRTGARAVLGLLLAWLAGLLLAGLGLLPANIIPFGFLVSAPAPPALVAMSGADHAADGRPGATSAVGIVLGTAAAVSANDFKPLDARELRALGVSQRSLRPGVPAVDPRGSMSPAPGARGVPTQPVDAPRAGSHGPAGVAPGGDRPNAPSATEPAAERPSSPAAPASNAGAGGDAADDRPAGNGSNGSGNANAGGGNANAGGGTTNPNAGGGNANAGGGTTNPNAGGGNANAGNGNANAGGGNANAGGGNANAGSGTTNPNAGGGNANAGGGNSAGGTGNAGSNAGGNTDANAAGSRGASSAGAGNGQSGNASSGDGSGGNGGAGKPRGRGADA